jgi:hypothetical protein
VKLLNMGVKMSHANERGVAEKLFGAVKGRLKASGGYQPDWGELSGPLEWAKGVAMVFCTGCGSVGEVDAAGLKALASLAGNVILPNSLSGYYFEINGCECCDAQMSTAKLRKTGDQ